METSASYEARYAPLPYPTNQVDCPAQKHLKQVTNKAASGDLKAVGLLAGLVRSAEERAISTPDANSEVDEADEMVMLGILKRLESKTDGGNEDI